MRKKSHLKQIFAEYFQWKNCRRICLEVLWFEDWEKRCPTGGQQMQYISRCLKREEGTAKQECKVGPHHELLETCKSQ